MSESGAADRTRTYDPIITNDVLYQLSYSGVFPGNAKARVVRADPIRIGCAANYRSLRSDARGIWQVPGGTPDIVFKGCRSRALNGAAGPPSVEETGPGVLVARVLVVLVRARVVRHALQRELDRPV